MIKLDGADLTTESNPIRTILEDRQFHGIVSLVEGMNGSRRSLLSGVSRALLYALARSLRPQHVVEIGSFKGGTTEVLAQALDENGFGTVHTVGPFDGSHFLEFYGTWAETLRSRTIFYECSSMPFFMSFQEKGIRTELVLIDGSHDYEYALFDIYSAARFLTPGGFIFIDNVSQAGPYFAAMDFLATQPGWSEFVFDGTTQRNEGVAYDRERRGVPGTDFIVLRAPRFPLVGRRPVTFGEVAWNSNSVRGLELSLGKHGPGTLMLQCILRGFSDSEQPEVEGLVSKTIDGNTDKLVSEFKAPLMVSADCQRYCVEPWVSWTGEAPLELKSVPIII